MSLDADRIAALEAELAEAQENERRINRERAALCTSLDHERAAHERTKAELTEARQKALERDTYYAGWEGRMDDLTRERDAAQAEAAAMREVLTWLDRLGGLGSDKHDAIRKALDGTAGRALAARVLLWKRAAKVLILCNPINPTAQDEVDDILAGLAALEAKDPADG